MSKTTALNAPNNNILAAHLEKGIKEFSENMDFIPIDGLHKWIVRIRGIDGIDDCFKSAEILIEFDTTKSIGDEKLSYPFNPPTFEVLTPNGKYAQGSKVCVSIGEYHSRPNEYSPADKGFGYKQNLGVAGFANFLILGLVSLDDFGGGMGIESKNGKQIAVISKEARAYNIKNHKNYSYMSDIYFIILIASGFWDVDPQNPGRLIRKGTDSQVKLVAKKIIGWAVGCRPLYTIEYVRSVIEEVCGPAVINDNILIQIHKIVVDHTTTS